MSDKHIEKPFGPPMTNGDWIRNMTDKELFAFFGHATLCDRMEFGWRKGHDGLCENCLVEWLQQPAEVDNE